MTGQSWRVKASEIENENWVKVQLQRKGRRKKKKNKDKGEISIEWWDYSGREKEKANKEQRRLSELVRLFIYLFFWESVYLFILIYTFKSPTQCFQISKRYVLCHYFQISIKYPSASAFYSSFHFLLQSSQQTSTFFRFCYQKK